MTGTKAVLSPCIGICELDDRGYCEGCFRHTSEIANWLSYDDQQRQRLMDDILPLRQASSS